MSGNQFCLSVTAQSTLRAKGEGPLDLLSRTRHEPCRAHLAIQIGVTKDVMDAPFRQPEDAPKPTI
jgi:hypothetical protein